jgi:hypothetical protein
VEDATVIMDREDPGLTSPSLSVRSVSDTAHHWNFGVTSSSSVLADERDGCWFLAHSLCSLASFDPRLAAESLDSALHRMGSTVHMRGDLGDASLARVLSRWRS